MLSWMLLSRGNILIVGWSIPVASLLTSTSASPLTGARMKWGVSIGRESCVDKGEDVDGCWVSIRMESSSRLAFLKTWFVSSL